MLEGGAQEEVTSQPWHHTQPSRSNSPGDLGSQRGAYSSQGVWLWAVAGPLQTSASPPHDTGSGSDPRCPPFSSAPSGLSLDLSPVQGCHRESGPDGGEASGLPGGVPEGTQLRAEEPGDSPHLTTHLFSNRVKLKP